MVVSLALPQRLVEIQYEVHILIVLKWEQESFFYVLVSEWKVEALSMELQVLQKNISSILSSGDWEWKFRKHTDEVIRLIQQVHLFLDRVL